MITGLFELRYDMPLLEFIGAVCHGSLKGLAMRLINGEFFHRTCYKVNKIYVTATFKDVILAFFLLTLNNFLQRRI